MDSAERQIDPGDKEMPSAIDTNTIRTEENNEAPLELSEYTPLASRDRKFTEPVKTMGIQSEETSKEITPAFTDRSLTESVMSQETNPASTDRTTIESVDKNDLQSELSEDITPVSTDRTATESKEQNDLQSEDINSVSTDRTYTISRKPTGLNSESEETTPVNSERLPDNEDSRHKLGFTPPLERPKDSAVAVGIIQELRKDGLLCSTPLIPRNTRQTRSGISFEYFFGPVRTATPRVLPKMKSDGNIGKTLNQRSEVLRRESPHRKNTIRRRKSACKPFRWHTGCRVAMERRRVQRDLADKRREQAQSKDEWKVPQFWQAVRQKQEKERKEDEQRRARERKILHDLMGRNFKDAFL